MDDRDMPGTERAAFRRSDDKIFQFHPREPAVEFETADRDWTPTVDLIKEAADIVRRAEERVKQVEDQARHLVATHRRQVKAAEMRAKLADRKAEAAEARAMEAEHWLARVQDAIVEGFGHYGLAPRSAAKRF